MLEFLAFLTLVIGFFFVRNILYIPLFVVWQAMSTPSYVEFMTQTLIGKVGMVIIVSVFFGSLWFVANKIFRST